jgi:CRISPR-associated endonuclease/helicase Cas3
MQGPRHIAQKPPQAALPLDRCLAKTYTVLHGDKSAIVSGRNVFEHACITGNVARVLMGLYPQVLREAFFPPGSAYTASTHDVGKVSPAFQKKLYSSTGDVPPDLENAPDPDGEQRWGYHSGIGQITLAACSVGKYLPEIVGRHHGNAPDLNGHRSTDKVLGGEAWHARRIELLDALKSHFKETWPCIDSRANADVIAGLTTVADWIASGPIFDDPYIPWQDGIDRAVREAGFVKADIVSGLSFGNIFSYDPYPVQEQFYSSCLGPGVYILEAPMGLGKTEAALYAAYNLLCEERATGVYFALPTRLTSNKIHQRVRDFLQKILAPGSPHNRPLLLHSKARLMDNLQDTEMGEEVSPGGEWFNSLKRAILAPFGVGTLDQALLAVLPDIRHDFVRSFGLLGKVVILDEVHTYDAYTGLLLDALVERLRQLHCTVIILSATLTRGRRAALLSSDAEREDYPLVSALALGSAHLCETPVSPQPDREVVLCACDSEQAAFGEAIGRSLQGQQVLWIENTVADAQESYRKLAALAPSGVERGLIHSRFLPHDRTKKEDLWTGYYGKDSGDRAKKGRVLVGTQVLEQSLDIDSDFLVTRLCPTDMFLQRLGRLWRHEERWDRAKRARREAWLLVPPQSETLLPEHFGKSAKVYEPYVLFRSLETLTPLSAVHLPSQIRHLIEATYAERPESGLLARLKTELKKEKNKLAMQARHARSEIGQARREGVATRYSELDDTRVLLVRKMEPSKASKEDIRIAFLGGEAFFPSDIKTHDRREWRRLACLLDSNTLTVAKHHAPDGAIRDPLKKVLGNFTYIGRGEDADLRLAIVTESGELRAMDGSHTSEKYRLEYQEHLGYVAIKK